MSGINVDALASQVAEKITEILVGTGKDIAAFAEAEGRKFAVSAAEITKLRLTGEIDDEEARLHLEIQKSASRTVLMAIAGISIIAAERAANAALEIVGQAIKTATGLNFGP